MINTILNRERFEKLAVFKNIAVVISFYITESLGHTASRITCGGC